MIFVLNHGRRRFVVVSDETSGAMTKVLDITEMIIGVEIASGVPWGFGRSKSKEIALA